MKLWSPRFARQVLDAFAWIFNLVSALSPTPVFRCFAVSLFRRTRLNRFYPCQYCPRLPRCAGLLYASLVFPLPKAAMSSIRKSLTPCGGGLCPAPGRGPSLSIPALGPQKKSKPYIALSPRHPFPASNIQSQNVLNIYLYQRIAGPCADTC